MATPFSILAWRILGTEGPGELQSMGSQRVIHDQVSNTFTFSQCGEKVILLHSWWEYKLVQLLWRTVWRFLRKTKNRATIYPASPLLGIYVKNTKTLAQKDTWALTCTAALFTTTETWAQPRCPSAEERTRKMWCVCMCVCVYIGLSLSHKKE